MWATGYEYYGDIPHSPATPEVAKRRQGRRVTKVLQDRSESGYAARATWWQFIVLGATLVILGVIAILAPVITTALSVLFFGAILALAGIVYLIKAFGLRGTDGFWASLIGGILALVVGVLLLSRPIVSILILTYLLSIYFLGSGIGRIVAGLAARVPSAGWVVVNGFVSLILGVLLLSGWPAVSLWVIGLFVGIDILFAGVWALAIGIAMHSGIAGRPYGRPV